MHGFKIFTLVASDKLRKIGGQERGPSPNRALDRGPESGSESGPEGDKKGVHILYRHPTVHT